jgi:hypothetical protein
MAVDWSATANVEDEAAAIAQPLRSKSHVFRADLMKASRPRTVDRESISFMRLLSSRPTFDLRPRLVRAVAPAANGWASLAFHRGHCGPLVAD